MLVYQFLWEIHFASPPIPNHAGAQAPARDTIRVPPNSSSRIAIAEEREIGGNAIIMISMAGAVGWHDE
jgi:hypothetical protein